MCGSRRCLKGSLPKCEGVARASLMRMSVGVVDSVRDGVVHIVRA